VGARGDEGGQKATLVATELIVRRAGAEVLAASATAVLAKVG